MELENAKHSIKLYVEHGCRPGSFIEAVLRNDLFGAIGKADATSLQILPDICRHVYNDIPNNCWGSTDIFNNWMNQKREE